jgi:hypothetical protein
MARRRARSSSVRCVRVRVDSGIGIADGGAVAEEVGVHVSDQRAVAVRNLDQGGVERAD